jgi:sugar O-acyltransferase (sialic acid O-acetyltransferase NeuD family)
MLDFEDDLSLAMSELTARAFEQDARIIVFGVGGFAKEIEWLLKQITVAKIVCVDKFEEHLINSDDLLAIGIGDPKIKEKIVRDYGKQRFFNVIAPNVLKDEISMGTGNIICNGNILTTGISLGNFNAINLSCTIGHNAKIGNYNQVNPQVAISGGVTIGDRCLIGTHATILENISICDDVIIGAGAVVTKDIKEAGTYIGIPARKI